MSKYLELAKKLKALADKGIGGEQVNAEVQLKKLMKKHNISMDDIEGEKVSYHHFSVKANYLQLFIQVISTVTGKGNKYFRDRERKGTIVLEITDVEAIEIHAKYNFFLKAYLKELDIFFTAFVHANDLYPKGGATNSMDELSDSERLRLKKASMMAVNMDKHNFRKQLT